MDQPEIIRPDRAPSTIQQGFSPFGCTLAAVGAGLAALSLVGAGLFAGIWAFSELLGLPDTVLYVFLAIAILPILWSGIWTGSRAWHVEKRLAAGHDIDQPQFGLTAYLRKR